MFLNDLRKDIERWHDSPVNFEVLNDEIPAIKRGNEYDKPLFNSPENPIDPAATAILQQIELGKMAIERERKHFMTDMAKTFYER